MFPDIEALLVRVVGEVMVFDLQQFLQERRFLLDLFLKQRNQVVVRLEVLDLVLLNHLELTLELLQQLIPRGIPHLLHLILCSRTLSLLVLLGVDVQELLHFLDVQGDFHLQELQVDLLLLDFTDVDLVDELILLVNHQHAVVDIQVEGQLFL